MGNILPIELTKCLMLWKSEVKVEDNCIFENYYKKTKNHERKKTATRR